MRSRDGWSAASVQRVEVEPLRLGLRAFGDLASPWRRRCRTNRSVIRLIGCRAPGRCRSVGRVTSTVSSTSTRASRSASSSVAAHRERLAYGRPARRRPACPAAARAAGGSAPISRLARASGERSPAWARRAALSASRVPAAAIAASAAVDCGVEVFRLEGSDLHRVERFGGHAGVILRQGARDAPSASGQAARKPKRIASISRAREWRPPAARQTACGGNGSTARTRWRV